MIHLRHLPSEVQVYKNVIKKHMLFNEKKLLHGIHGIVHMIRTANFALEIVQRSANQIDYVDHEVIFFASLLHDIGRMDDSADPKHGFRAVSAVLYSLEEFEQLQIFSGIPVAIGMICAIIIEHSEPGPGSFNHATVVKDADRVERIRLGEDALDLDQLSFGVARNMVPEAGDFIQKYTIYDDFWKRQEKEVEEEDATESE